MPELMRGDLDPLAPAIRPQPDLAVAVAQGLVPVDEYRLRQGEGWPALRQVSLQGIARNLAEVNDPVFQPLGLFDAQPTVLPIDVGQFKPANLTGAQAAVQHELEPGAVHQAHYPSTLFRTGLGGSVDEEGLRWRPAARGAPT